MPFEVETIWTFEITVNQAAELIGITPQRVKKLLVDGKLKGRKVKGRWQVDHISALDRQHEKSRGLLDVGG